MNKEILERANILNSIIQQTDRQIEKLEELKDSHEIMIMMNGPLIKKALRHIYYNDLNPAPFYYTGGTKDKIVDVMLEREIKFRDGRMEEFKKL